jgi:hypothetical protein
MISLRGPMTVPIPRTVEMARDFGRGRAPRSRAGEAYGQFYWRALEFASARWLLAMKTEIPSFNGRCERTAAGEARRQTHLITHKGGTSLAPGIESMARVYPVMAAVPCRAAQFWGRR